jgi:hypothetical protein
LRIAERACQVLGSSHASSSDPSASTRVERRALAIAEWTGVRYAVRQTIDLMQEAEYGRPPLLT